MFFSKDSNDIDIEQLKETLKVDEGVVYEIYHDHLGYPTFGIGHLVKLLLICKLKLNI